MADIAYDFPVRATVERVFAAVSTPAGLDAWWTKQSQGEPSLGSWYALDFGPGYQWRAVVTLSEAPLRFELQLVDAMADWMHTCVAVSLDAGSDVTTVHFSHRGWEGPTEHFRTSAFCWAMYLRLLRRYVELGEVVPYEERLEA